MAVRAKLEIYWVLCGALNLRLGKIYNIDLSTCTFPFSHKIYSTCVNLFPPVFSSIASLQLKFYEITDSFKKKLSSKAVKGHKGSTPFLQHLVYKCFLLSSIRLICNHGLFPTLQNYSSRVSPDLTTVYKYIV